MSSQSFADLGVSRAVSSALAERGITEPFAIQKLVVADVLAGRDVLAQSPTGSGKTLAFGVPMVDRIEADRPPPGRAGPRPDARARLADRRGDSPGRARPRAEDRLRLRRRRHPEAVARRGPGADRRRHARPPRGPPRPPRVRPAQRQGARARRGRPDARHGLQARGRPDRRPVPARPADAVLLGHARGRGRAVSPALTPQDAVAAHARGRHQAPRGDRAPLHARRARRQARRARARAANRRPRPGPGVRAHEARRRPAGQAPRRARASMPSPCTATSRRRSARRRSPASSRAASTRSSPPTSPRAASTSRDISHVINFDPPEDHDTYTHRIGRTARAGRTGVGITFFGAEHAGDLEKIAAKLELHARVRARAGSAAAVRRSAPTRAVGHTLVGMAVTGASAAEARATARGRTRAPRATATAPATAAAARSAASSRSFERRRGRRDAQAPQAHRRDERRRPPERLRRGERRRRPPPRPLARSSGQAQDVLGDLDVNVNVEIAQTAGFAAEGPSLPSPPRLTLVGPCRSGSSPDPPMPPRPLTCWARSAIAWPTSRSWSSRRSATSSTPSARRPSAAPSSARASSASPGCSTRSPSAAPTSRRAGARRTSSAS